MPSIIFNIARKIWITVCVVCFLSIAVFSQPIDSYSSDKSGIYYYSVDSLIKLLPSVDQFDRIVVRASRFAFNGGLEKIENRSIIFKETESCKRQKIKNNELLINVKPIIIEGPQFRLSLVVFAKLNNDFSFYADGLYVMYYQWDKSRLAYRVSKIEQGITQ